MTNIPAYNAELMYGYVGVVISKLTSVTSRANSKPNYTWAGLRKACRTIPRYVKMVRVHSRFRAELVLQHFGEILQQPMGWKDRY